MCGIFFLLYRKSVWIEKYHSYNNFISWALEHSEKIKHRGPDETQIRYFEKNGWIIIFVFYRLSIIDVSHDAMQPFEKDGIFCIVNGEIYNYKNIYKTELNDYIKQSNSDCEVILPLFLKYKNIEFVCSILDGEYSFVIYDSNQNKIYIGTDELSIRPLFVSYNNDSIGLASESKALLFHDTILRVQPGMYSVLSPEYISVNFMKHYCYPKWNNKLSYEDVKKGIHDIIVENVKMKLNSDREHCFLLSGGLDSSIICAIASRYSNERIKTFCIGFHPSKDEKLPTDILAARKVASHINSVHHEIMLTYKEGIDVIQEVIRIGETWDQTTIRASIPMYLGIKKIREMYSNIAIIFSGEVSDELFQGYLYNLYSPSLEDGKKDSMRLLKNICYFDGLRVDRMVSAFGFELRLPFFSRKLLNFVFSSHPKYISPINGIEKKILREAFESYLPQEIVWRTKNALSDATSHKSIWKTKIHEYCTNLGYSNEDEYYKNIFSYYFYSKNIIPYKWMPQWVNATDSSASTLHKYKEDDI